LAVFSSYICALKPGGSMYVCHPSSWQREFQGALELSGFEVRCQIIWAKNTFAWGPGAESLSLQWLALGHGHRPVAAEDARSRVHCNAEALLLSPLKPRVIAGPLRILLCSETRLSEIVHAIARV
jgi:hypothetical protein